MAVIAPGLKLIEEYGIDIDDEMHISHESAFVVCRTDGISVEDLSALERLGFEIKLAELVYPI